MPSPKTTCSRNVVASPALRFELRFSAPARRVAGEIELVVEHVVPLDEPEDAGDLDVAPAAAHPVLAGEVGGREPRLDVLQLDAVRVHALVAAGARPLDREGEARVALDGHPAHLHVAEEHHARRSPVLDRVREHVDVHERAPVLPGAEGAQLAVGVPQPERRLAGVDARAEQLELELRLQLAELGRRRRPHAEPALAHAGERAAVLAELLVVRSAASSPAACRTSPGRSA